MGTAKFQKPGSGVPGSKPRGVPLRLWPGPAMGPPMAKGDQYCHQQRVPDRRRPGPPWAAARWLHNKSRATQGAIWLIGLVQPGALGQGGRHVWPAVPSIPSDSIPTPIQPKNFQILPKRGHWAIGTAGMIKPRFVCPAKRPSYRSSPFSPPSPPRNRDSLQTKNKPYRPKKPGLPPLHRATQNWTGLRGKVTFCLDPNFRQKTYVPSKFAARWVLTWPAGRDKKPWRQWPLTTVYFSMDQVRHHGQRKLRPRSWILLSAIRAQSCSCFFGKCGGPEEKEPGSADLDFLPMPRFSAVRGDVERGLIFPPRFPNRCRRFYLDSEPYLQPSRGPRGFDYWDRDGSTTTKPRVWEHNKGGVPRNNLRQTSLPWAIGYGKPANHSSSPVFCQFRLPTGALLGFVFRIKNRWFPDGVQDDASGPDPITQGNLFDGPRSFDRDRCTQGNPRTRVARSKPPAFD